MTIALEPDEPITASERRSTAIDWHILTGEYPPECGGVGHYTRLVARGLAAAGDG